MISLSFYMPDVYKLFSTNGNDEVRIMFHLTSIIFLFTHSFYILIYFEGFEFIDIESIGRQFKKRTHRSNSELSIL